jgi:DNA polymerase I-like protein with 3'-5' exonuclease and polymerase domains
MVDIWESGVLNEGVHVQLTVHDELDGSVERTNRARAALEEMVHLMEVAVPLCIPTKVSCETGTSWATTH